MNLHETTLMMPQERADFFSRLLKLTNNEIYAIYGLKRNESFSETAVFDDGTKIQIRLVIQEKTTPYAEAVMFRNNSEVCCTDPEDEFMGEWSIEYGDNKYVVKIIST